MLPIKKIYVDSRHKTEDSISDSNFKFPLPFVLTMPHNATFFISDICIPHIWCTIDKDVNDKLYVGVGHRNPVMTSYITTWFDHICVVPPGNYDESSLTAAINLLVHALHPSITASIDASNVMTITTSYYYESFRIYTDNEVMNKINIVTGGYIDQAITSDPQSINENLSNIKAISHIYSGKYPGNTTGDDTFTVNRLVLHPINNLYLTSSNLGSYDTISAFSDNCIKKIPITADYGFMIVDQLVSPGDYLNCGNTTLSVLDFRLRYGRGRIVNLYGNYITFSIVFDIK